MNGFLGHLELAPGISLLHKKVWSKRFFKIDAAFRTLEFFADATLQDRKGRIALEHAHVVTAEELGELLMRPDSIGTTSSGHGSEHRHHSVSGPSSSSSVSSSHRRISGKISIENSKRFVIRVSEPGAKEHHYLCAEVLEGIQVDASASRKYMHQWMQALHACTAQAPSVYAVGDRDVCAGLMAFMDQLHITATVSGRKTGEKQGKSSYEIACKAWVLQRELVPVDNEESYANGDDHRRGSSSSSGKKAKPKEEWQVLEYASAWTLLKTTAQLREFDHQLRLLFHDQLRDIAFPPKSEALVSKLLHPLDSFTHAHEEEESKRRVGVRDAYLQQLLCLPAFSVFGSDGSAMLDTFLEISTHLAPLKKLETAMGASLHLRKKQIVRWTERERFEMLYQIYTGRAAAYERSMLKLQQESSRNSERERHQSHHSEHERSHRHHHHSNSSSSSRHEAAKGEDAKDIHDDAESDTDGDSPTPPGDATWVVPIKRGSIKDEVWLVL